MRRGYCESIETLNFIFRQIMNWSLENLHFQIFSKHLELGLKHFQHLVCQPMAAINSKHINIYELK